MDQGAILTYYYLISTFHKVPYIVIPLSGQCKKKNPFWKEFTILNVINNINDSKENVNNHRNLTYVDFNPQWQLGEVQDFCREVTTDVLEIARVPKLEVELEYVMELLQSHDKILMDKKLVLMIWAKKMVSWDGIYS